MTNRNDSKKFLYKKFTIKWSWLRPILRLKLSDFLEILGQKFLNNESTPIATTLSISGHLLASGRGNYFPLEETGRYTRNSWKKTVRVNSHYLRDSFASVSAGLEEISARLNLMVKAELAELSAGAPMNPGDPETRCQYLEKLLGNWTNIFKYLNILT